MIVNVRVMKRRQFLRKRFNKCVVLCTINGILQNVIQIKFQIYEYGPETHKIIVSKIMLI